jgi:GntR family transcriptional regulator
MRSAPLYVHVKHALLREIAAGRLRPGDQVPTEDELMRAHDVSRATVRQALGLLREQGLIERYPRRGTFVTEPRPHSAWVASSIEDVVLIGAETVPEQLDWRAVRAPDAAARLGLGARDPVYRLRSVRCHRGTPVYFVQAYVPFEIGQQLRREDLMPRILMEVIEQKLGMRIANGIEEISAAVADRGLATRLRIPLGAPLLVVSLLYFTVGGRPIEYAEAWFRADQFKRRNALTRGRGTVPPAEVDLAQHRAW